MNSFAGIAQQRVPAASPAGDAVSNPHPAPSFLDVAEWRRGHADGFAGLRFQLTEADLRERAGSLALISYMRGHRAGEIDRTKGGADAL